MNCLDEGRLRAWLDHESDNQETREITHHVEQCSPCRDRVEVLKQRSAHLSSLLSAPDAADQPDAEAALQRWRNRRTPGTEAPGTARILRAFSSRPPSPGTILRAPSPRALTAAAALLIAVVFTVSGTSRAWVVRVLEMLRVNKVVAIPVESEPLTSPQGQQAGQMLARLISSNLVVTMKPGPPLRVSNAAAASAAAGFAVRLPAGQTPATLQVNGESAFQMTMDRDRLQSIFDEAGRPDLQLPANLQHALVAVHIPRAVVATYGNCPTPQEHRNRRAWPGCSMLIQVPSPTVSVPPHLNLQQLAAMGLQLTGMSATEATRLSRTIDWTSTLVIPVPQNIASSQTVPVDGSQGVLILQQRHQPSPRYNLVWTRRGRVYSIAGWGDPAQAEAMANSLE